MNIRERVEVENKTNNDFLSIPAIHWIVSVCQKNIDRKRKKRRQKKKIERSSR